jgi:DNA mismatch repair protein MutL
MPRIRQLDSNVVNKIAAGEVIERPASVVKELLENSVDALATRIEVDIADGGAELIRVVDDGEGMHPDDLCLAVTSHATSKISSDEELFSVQTMGFRGEALASIASVSRFRIRTRQVDDSKGCELEVNGGIAGQLQEIGCATGTLIEVKQLFANTPVRRKFLKTINTEFGHISEQFSRIAIANPRLHLTLRHNGKLVYELPATGRLLDRLRLFFGSDLADRLIEIESESYVEGSDNERIRLWGYVAHPGQSKSNRKGQYLFLNGRWIQDRSLQHALNEAYRGLLMVNRFPISYLFLEMPPRLVDVNVHPSKSEVRFRDGQQLYRQLLSTIRNRFLTEDLDGAMAAPPSTQPSAAAAPNEHQLQLKDELNAWSGAALGAATAGFGQSPGHSSHVIALPPPPMISPLAEPVDEPVSIRRSSNTDP